MKLKQVLINLLGNAVKFTPAPGSVSLTVERTLRAEHHWALRFIVKDTGIAYNLILVDLRMPGQDGVAVTREIRKIIGNETAVILLTAYDWSDVEDTARSGRGQLPPQAALRLDRAAGVPAGDGAPRPRRRAGLGGLRSPHVESEGMRGALKPYPISSVQGDLYGKAMGFDGIMARYLQKGGNVI